MTERKSAGRVSIDCGVMIRWLREKRDDRTEECVEAVETVLANKGAIVIAAPTLAEVLRGGRSSKIPRRKGITVVGFDARAAELLAAHFPTVKQKRIAKEQRTSHRCIKYDAMIVACSIRHAVQMHIALDEDHHRLCEAAGLPWHWPADLLEKQVPLGY